jgi:two-component system, LytTR family, response regulator
MKINCLIVDDEPEAIRVISSYLDKMEGFHIEGKASNAIEAFQILQQKKIDLMFLDIKMPKLNGIDFLKSLSNSSKVIITTAYREFALDGFDLDVVDYLLKPISMERFLKSISKIYKISNLEHFNPVNDQNYPQSQPFIYVKADRKMVKIFLEDIYFIESIKDYVKIITENKIVVAKQRISFLEQMLPEGNFIRIHRSFIISIQKIEAFTSNFIEIKGHSLPVGNMYKNTIVQSLKIQ